jgi:uncharacterized protein
MRQLPLALAAAAVLAAMIVAPPSGRADINLSPVLGNNIVAAADANDVDRVRQFLAAHDDINYTDNQGRSALIHVAMSGNAEIARLLVQGGVRLDLADKTGNAPLHYAADAGHADIVQLLLDAKVPVDQPNREGVTPLMMAAGHGRAAVVKLLLAHGADPRKTDYTGRDALSWAQDGRQNQIVQLLRQAR